MSLCFCPTSVHQSQGWPRPQANFSLLSTNLVLPFSPHPHCLSPSNLNPRRSRCRAANPRSPPPPESKLPPTEGPEATFARLQDAVQIFLAVLFWMSLFFWASAWDGRNDDRPNKGSRFRR
ncbi:hypothetical protein RHSIM_Rhsim08G0213600 [Rhododendron simsii]|uniref:Uncharacterized protein n=1 Tax=Rhododendron simsii TaxID=118357 RepID=A0A834LGH5_RHOSS|nr:hypothetical protein RHSIM_Rhsim08G0213600 [Rhododendron simsii]